MIEVITQEIVEEWNRILEGNIKRVMEFLLELGILWEQAKKTIE